jgi:hypothetical protein
VVNDENSKIDFSIIDPNQKVIYQSNAKIHLFYEFNATLPGEYIFQLDNRKNDEMKKVTFAIHQGNSTNTDLSHELLKKVWDKIKVINRNIKSSRFTARMLNKKYDAHYDITLKHNRHIVMFSIIETSLMILIFFLQLFYIKRLANKY